MTGEFRAAALIGLLFVGGAPVAGSESPRSKPTAGELVARVVEARKGLGLTGRARLVRFDSRTGKSDIKRLIVKIRQDSSSTKMLYQVVGPRGAARQALVLDLPAGKRPTGFLVDGDSVVPLTPKAFEQPFLGSDLTIGDLTDDFLSWPVHVLVGEEELLGRRCSIVESSRSARAGSPAAKVRSWISRDLALPLRVERLSAEGRLVRRLSVERVRRLDANHWTAASVTVGSADAETRTTLQGTSGDGHATISDSEFAIETIQRALKGSPRSATDEADPVRSP